MEIRYAIPLFLLAIILGLTPSQGHPEVKRERPDVEVFNPPAARLPIHNQDQPNNIEDHAPKNTAPENAAPENAAPENVAPENVPLENVAPALPTGGLRQRHQAPHLVYSEKRSPTLQPPIERSKIANYWVFDYTFKQQQYLFIMRCPSPNCQNAIFTHHPLKRNRAADHFRACGMHFRNERDMVQRYARQGPCSRGPLPSLPLYSDGLLTIFRWY